MDELTKIRWFESKLDTEALHREALLVLDGTTGAKCDWAG